MLWETGASMIQPVEATHCTYDNQTCYQARTVPVIFNMSSNTGYKTGGQNLTVQGYGFNGDISATLDGVACTITRSSDFSFSCIVETKAEVSTSLSNPNATFVGSNGLRRIIYNHTSSMNLDNLTAYNQSQ